jgi:hypothetical protein
MNFAAESFYKVDHPKNFVFDSLTGRLCLTPQFQILGTVIQPIAVFVMDAFKFLNRASKNFFHDKMMLKPGFTVDRLYTVTLIRDASAFAASFARAFVRAEKSIFAVHVRRFSINKFSTLFAIKSARPFRFALQVAFSRAKFLHSGKIGSEHSCLSAYGACDRLSNISHAPVIRHSAAFLRAINTRTFRSIKNSFAFFTGLYHKLSPLVEHYHQRHYVSSYKAGNLGGRAKYLILEAACRF